VAVGPDTGEMETVADRIPADIRAALQPVQVKRLAEMLAPQPMEHGIDYRVSTTLFGQRFYLAVITGPELRTRRRLIRDGQHRSLKWLMFDFLLAYAAVSALLVSILLVTAVVAYLVKSGLGIDLFDGPSFLHQFFFD
jgi:hypothetical protein